MNTVQGNEIPNPSDEDESYLAFLRKRLKVANSHNESLFRDNERLKKEIRQLYRLLKKRE